MRSDIYRLERISLVGHQLLQVIESRSITRDTLVRDVETQWLVTTPWEFVEGHPEAPWVQIAGLRHRLVHDYEGTNWNMIAAVVFDELEPFIGCVDDLLSSE